MKNLSLLISFTFFFFLASQAQVYPSWISNDLFPDANSSTATAVEIDPSGNILVAGTIYDIDLPYENIFVAKYSAQGGLLWLQTYGSPDTLAMTPNTICIDGQGNAYLAFMRHSAAESYWSIAVQKYNATDGTIQWTTELVDANFNGFEWQVKPKYMTIDGNNLYVAGTKFDPGLPGSEMLSIKIDFNGNIMWTATHKGSGSNANAKAIAVDQTGNVYIAGDAWNTSIDYCLVKFSPVGDFVWDAFLDGDIYHNTDIAESVLVDGSGNVYVTGYNQISSNQKDIVTAKYDQYGNFQWKQSYGNPAYSSNNAYYLELTDAGDLLVGGYSAYEVPYPGTGKDFILLKYTPSGNLIWDARYDYKNYLDDHPFDFDLGPEGNVYICGFTMKDCHVHKFINVVKVDALGAIEWDVQVPNLYGIPWGIASTDEDEFVVVAGAFDSIQVNAATTIRYENGTPPVYEAEILDVYFEAQILPPVIDVENQRIIATVHDTANIEYLVPYISRSEYSCMYPEDEVVTSFIEPIWYNVTSFDDEIEKWWYLVVEGGYVGADELTKEDLLIFPNPANDVVQFSSAIFNQQSSKLEIFDMNGRSVLKKNIPAGSAVIEITVKHLKEGVYCCRWITKNKVISNKLIVQ